MYVHHALAYQASHPCDVGKLVPAISRSNNATAVVGCSWQQPGQVKLLVARVT